MKITFESHKLMSFFVENNCLNPIKQSKPTDHLLEGIFKELLEGVDAVAIEKQKHKSSFYNPKIIIKCRVFVFTHAMLLIDTYTTIKFQVEILKPI